MARDWNKAFRHASFRGVPFWVEVEEFAGGRRVSVQHVAYGERPITEDFGQAARSTPIAAYLTGDDADTKAAALNAALSAPGPGFLILPMQGARFAHATDFRQLRLRDRGGMIRFDIGFLDAGSIVSFAPDFGANAAIAAFDRLTSAILSEI